MIQVKSEHSNAPFSSCSSFGRNEPDLTSTSYSVLMSLYFRESPSNLERSLNCMINQTIPPDEIVLVEDGALTKELNQVVASFVERHPNLFKVIGYSENRGLWYALRYGMDRCSNELIVRMDTDDYSVPDRVEKQLEVIARDPSIDCVGSNVVEFEGSPDNQISTVVLPATHADIIRFGKRRCPFRHPALLYRKSAVLRAGGYEEMPMFEDYDLYMRMVKTGAKFENVQEFLVYMGTSPDFYQRRGNVSYLKKMIHFRGECLKRGDVNIFEYLTSVIPHSVVCILPNSFRTMIYKKLLRKNPVRQGMV